VLVVTPLFKALYLAVQEAEKMKDRMAAIRLQAAGRA
jgi:hypothetical protein